MATTFLRVARRIVYVVSCILKIKIMKEGNICKYKTYQLKCNKFDNTAPLVKAVATQLGTLLKQMHNHGLKIDPLLDSGLNQQGGVDEAPVACSGSQYGGRCLLVSHLKV